MAPRRKRVDPAVGRRDVFAVELEDKESGSGAVVVARIDDPRAFVAARNCALSGDIVDMIASFVADLALPPDDRSVGGDA